MITNAVYRTRNQGVVVNEINRPDRKLILELKKAYSALILDHLGKSAYIKGVKPLFEGISICGPAVTVSGPDLNLRRMAIDLAAEGDVLVVANDGITDYACFGDGTALRMQLKNMEACVIDGATRDSGRLKKMGFPTFCKGVTPKNYHYPVSIEYGAVNVPVACSGLTINPGDLIFGDDDGVVVIPLEMVEDLTPVILDNLEKEIIFRERMKTFEPFNVKEILAENGYSFI